MRSLFLNLILSLIVIGIHAQNVGIGTMSPEASAALDVTSPTNDQGLLIPRMLESQRTTIPTPAEGLMVYQTDGTAGLYVFKSGQWTTFVTAPNTLPGWELRIASGSVNNASTNARYYVSVNCPVGKMAIGGGFQINPSSTSCGYSTAESSTLPPFPGAIALSGSESIPVTGYGWTAVVMNRVISACNYTVVVCVICATVQ